MSLNYYLGCPQWQHPRWKSILGAPEGQPLSLYAQTFNSVEGNTTFYSLPAPRQSERWRQQVPDHFRFAFKFPRQISHDAQLINCAQETTRFVHTMQPLLDVCGPFMLQLSAQFSASQLDSLWRFLDALPEHLDIAVEVRHPDFFAKGESERQLNRGLLERRISRVCFDSRALFSALPDDEATREAQRKKPRLPVHILDQMECPMVRFIGHPQLEKNTEFLRPWATKMSQWLAQGKHPYFFVHMPDIGDALQLAQLWHELINEVSSVAGTWSLPQKAEQPQQGLF